MQDVAADRPDASVEGVATKGNLAARLLVASPDVPSHPDAELLLRHSPEYVILPEAISDVAPPYPAGEHDYQPHRVEQYFDDAHAIRQVPSGWLGWVNIVATGVTYLLATVAVIAFLVGQFLLALGLALAVGGLLAMAGVFWYLYRYGTTPRDASALRSRVASDERRGIEFAATVVADLGVAPELQAWRQYVSAVSRPGARPTIYARTVEEPGLLVLQYWSFYYYNHWSNRHEADWEVVMVFLDPETRNPRAVAASSHLGGRWRSWKDTEPFDDSKQHPRIYVARGSHAQYFSAAEGMHESVLHAPWALLAFKGKFSVTGKTDFVGTPQRPGGEYELVAIPPTAERADTGTPEWDRWWWLQFRGRWGASEGILGPAIQEDGRRWARPMAWVSDACVADSTSWKDAVMP